TGNIYTSPSITSPFVMGLFSPKIYLPASLTARERDYILLHEQTHIKRLDHAVKLFCFFVLCVHWFNPLVWVAFFLSGRDMELSCDVKKDYSTSLLTLATGRRIVGGTPLAFGEGDTKSRIKNVLNYKKPAFWVIVVSVIAVVAIGVGLMANPKEKSAELDAAQALWDARTEYV
ncbi:MAG: M56 family metallopeptidase, partial [Oscillospiraceae bacterium]